MATEIIGRKTEQKMLMDCYHSTKAELVAVYGRRRVGKTFLVKSMFGDRFDYYVTGIYEGSKADELAQFHRQLLACSGIPYPVPGTWMEAFDQLKHYLGSLKKERIVVFIDEMPWLDTPRSEFVRAFDLFWNEWASSRDNLLCIICGSATTWMNDKVIGQKGGLHGRTTRRIKLSQFTLGETEQFLKSNGIRWNRHQIAECWMIMGGTPYYLDLLQNGWSLAQNIDFLFFRQDAELRNEYPLLLKSLFKDSIVYRKVIETLALHSKGLTRNELMAAVGKTGGGDFSTVLENLCNCDFIRSYTAYGKKERDTMYQLIDMFTLFHLRFLARGNGQDEQFWSHSIDSPARRNWSGHAFEILCLNHLAQIKEALGIRGILSNVYSWYLKADKEHSIPGGQIDLLIDRRDQVINICEAKFTLAPFTITPKYYQEMLDRMELFRQTTRTRSALHLTMISASGLQENEYSGAIQSLITLEDLFS